MLSPYLDWLSYKFTTLNMFLVYLFRVTLAIKSKYTQINTEMANTYVCMNVHMLGQDEC